MSEMVYICAAGAGDNKTVTVEAGRIIREADVLTGAARLVETADSGAVRRPAVDPYEIAGICESEKGTVCVLMSGDTGFYSGTERLGKILSDKGIEYRVVPGISSMQYLAAALKRSWQDWTLASVHGKDEDIFELIEKGKPVFLLTGSSKSPKDIAAMLCDAGLHGARLTVGERLSYPDERIETYTANIASKKDFDPLNVVLIEALKTSVKRAPGIEDTAFIRGDVPMTKQEIRAVVMAKSGITEGEVCWDIGAGTGSVSVEMAMIAKEVWAVERNDEGIKLINANREKFRRRNIHVLKGEAPGCLTELPAPDFVFIGGSGGHLKEIIACALEKNKDARLMVTAIALETLAKATEALKEAGLKADVVQIACSRAEDTGKLHMLRAENPIFIIRGIRA